jgi:hypothetical protein
MPFFLFCRKKLGSCYSTILIWQVTNRMFLAVWFIGVPTSMGAIAVFALNTEFFAIRREIKNGSFSPWSYIVSNALFQVSIFL